MARTTRCAPGHEAEDETRERRIRDEIVVDAHDEDEQAMGWHAYLDNTLQCPFDAVCDVAREISVLRPGDKVTLY